MTSFIHYYNPMQGSWSVSKGLDYFIKCLRGLLIEISSPLSHVTQQKWRLVAEIQKFSDLFQAFWVLLAHLAMPKWAYMIIICRWCCCCWCCCCQCCWRLCLWAVYPVIFKIAAYDTIVSIWRQLIETYLIVVTSCEYFCTFNWLF